MVSSTSTPIPFTPWTPDSAEARRLAEALRERRLSFLSGEKGAGKTSLIVDGLMPLLRRRATDGAIGTERRESGVIMPFPERRSAARARLAELVVYFAQWDDAPLIGLQRAIDAAVQWAGGEAEPGIVGVADRVKTLADRYGTRLLFVLDGFESFLEQWNRTEPNPFVEELARLLNRRLPAHVLITLRNDSEPALQALGEKLFIGDAEMFVLPRWRDADAAVLDAESEPDQPPAPVSSPPPTPRMRVVPRLAETVAATTAPPAHSPRAQASLASTGHEHGEAISQPTVLTAAAPRGPHRFMARRIRLLTIGVVAALAATSICLLALRAREVTPSSTAATTPTTPASRMERALQNPVKPAPPRIDLQVDAEQGVAPRLPAELARALDADGAMDLHIATEGSGSAAGTHLSVVRYDALSAAAAQQYRPGGIAVITPLYTEELFVVVRADSPLRSIDQLEGRRINVGPEYGDRALTASTVYRRMFGKSPVPSRDAHLAAVEALERLAQGGALDAVLLVEPQPAATLNALPATFRQSLRLLPLDPGKPAGRRLLQAYLPATLRSASLAGTAQTKPVPTVSAMAFLVSHGTPNEATSNALVGFVESLCRVLPQLRRDGDPKWRELRPGQQLETGWPELPATQAAWGQCAGTGSPNQATSNSTRSSSKGEHP